MRVGLVGTGIEPQPAVTKSASKEAALIVSSIYWLLQRTPAKQQDVPSYAEDLGRRLADAPGLPGIGGAPRRPCTLHQLMCHAGWPLTEVFGRMCLIPV